MPLAGHSGLPARYTASDRLEFATARSRQLFDHLTSAPGALASSFGKLGEVAGVNQVDGLPGDPRLRRELRCYVLPLKLDEGFGARIAQAR